MILDIVKDEYYSGCEAKWDPTSIIGVDVFGLDFSLFVTLHTKYGNDIKFVADKNQNLQEIIDSGYYSDILTGLESDSIKPETKPETKKVKNLW